MVRVSFLLTLIVAAVVSPTVAVADVQDDVCGNDPNCFVEGGYPGDGLGIPAGFLVLALLAVVSFAFAAYRVRAARDMATRAGLDPDDATRVALMEEDGLAATYLASQLSTRRPQPEPVPARSVAERLRELDGLRDQGLVTEAEYAERRTAILGSV